MDPYVMDWAERAGAMAEAVHDDERWHATVAAGLVRAGDTTAVDVGCGAGAMTVALAAALGPGGRVVAVDGSAEMLAVAAEQARSRTGLAQVDLVEADLHAGPAPVRAALAGPVDLVWASASVHHLGDQQAAVDDLASLLRPGGRLALAEGGLPARHLPWDLGIGEPGLEARLIAANNAWFTRMRAALPGHVRMPYGWTGALRRAGLVDVTTRSVLWERPVPLDERDRARVLHNLGHWVERLGPTGLLPEADLGVWDRLLDRDDPAWLGRRDDLEWLRVDSIHLGVGPG